MSKKTLAILSYVTIIGWLISFFQQKNDENKSSLVRYHLKQGLGVFIVAVIFNIALMVVASIVPALAILGLVGYAFWIFMIFGIINAANEQMKPVPLIGGMFVDKFDFIN